jgi:hypothetical protein
LLSKRPDTRRACELHTHKLWQSHADTDGDTDGNSHADSYANCDSNSYAHADSYANGNGNPNTPAEINPDAEATSDTATSPIAGGC